MGSLFIHYTKSFSREMSQPHPDHPTTYPGPLPLGWMTTNFTPLKAKWTRFDKSLGRCRKMMVSVQHYFPKHLLSPHYVSDPMLGAHLWIRYSPGFGILSPHKAEREQVISELWWSVWYSVMNKMGERRGTRKSPSLAACVWWWGWGWRFSEGMRATFKGEVAWPRSG